MTEVEYQAPRHIKVGEVSLCLDSFGSPQHPPIILIMGLAAQLLHWDEGFCRQLAAQGFWVIRFDNRDIGLSTKLSHLPPPTVTSMLAGHWFGKLKKPAYVLDDMATDTLRLMDALGLERANLVGVSMGGMISQCAALLEPERIISLTSIMSTTGDRKLPKPSTSMSLKLIKPMPRDEEGFMRQALELWRTLHGEHYPFDLAHMESVIRAARKRSFNPAGVLRQLGAIMASPDRTPALAKLAVPTMVIHGDLDPLVPLECGLATARAIPEAKLDVINGMGHTLPMQVWPRLIANIQQVAEAGG